MLKKLVNLLLASVAFIIAVSVISTMGPGLHREYIRRHVGSRVVTITKGRSGGTGFIVKAPSGNNYIMTNKHVCELAGKDTSLDVSVEGAFLPVKRSIIEKYTDHDLCLLETVDGIEGLDIASGLSVGQSIGLIGHPKLWPLTLSKGEFLGYRSIKLAKQVMSKEECPGEVEEVNIFFGTILLCLEEQTAEQLMIYSRGGSSGSPVVNFLGNVVGVLFAGNPQDQFESFAVPLIEIKTFLKDK